MNDQPDESQGRWHFKQGQLWRFREGPLLRIESANLDTVEYVIQRADGSWPKLPIMLHKHHLIESMTNGGAVLVEPIDERIAKLEAVNHEQAESLIVLADKNMKLAAERDRLAREGERLTHDLDNALEVAKMLAGDFEAEEKRLRAQVEQLTDNPELDATDGAAPAWWRAHDHTAAVFCQHVNVILDGKDNGSGANTEPWGSTRKRLLGLVGELSAIDAALARRPVFDDLKTRAEKVWRACDTAAGLDRQLADARGYEIRFKALEPKLKDCEAALNQYRLSAELQRHAAAEAVRQVKDKWEKKRILSMKAQRQANHSGMSDAATMAAHYVEWCDEVLDDIAVLVGAAQEDETDGETK